MYREQYPLKTMTELKMQEIIDLLAESRRIIEEAIARMDKVHQRILEIKAKTEKPIGE